MTRNTKQTNTKENILYNNILLLSRNKVLFTKFNLTDSFQNRIILLFIHISFLFIKLNENSGIKRYKVIYQRLFDFLFKQIELNMREIGYGDVQVNKNMKLLVKSFYNILLYCEDYKKKQSESKKDFFSKYLLLNISKKTPNNNHIIEYFDKFQTFCFDLNSDSVLKGKLNFKYN